MRAQCEMLYSINLRRNSDFVMEMHGVAPAIGQKLLAGSKKGIRGSPARSGKAPRAFYDDFRGVICGAT
jgi:hypothetical protein